MQTMRIIGKFKDGHFTKGEIERTQTRLEDKNLEIRGTKTSGAEAGFTLSTARKKTTGEKISTKFLVKKGTPEDHLKEITGARFYEAFSGEFGNLTSKTRLLLS